MDLRAPVVFGRRGLFRAPGAVWALKCRQDGARQAQRGDGPEYRTEHECPREGDRVPFDVLHSSNPNAQRLDHVGPNVSHVAPAVDALAFGVDEPEAVILREQHLDVEIILTRCVAGHPVTDPGGAVLIKCYDHAVVIVSYRW